MNIRQTFITKNYTRGRGGGKLDTIVLHTYDGLGGDLYNWWQKNDRNVSANYCVLLDGTAYQYVREGDTAHHAGAPEWNFRSIGIEHQDNANPNGVHRTVKQYNTSAAIVFDVCYRNSIPINRDTIKLHREISTGRSCPGNLNRDTIIEKAQKYMDDLKAYKTKSEQLQRQLDISNSSIENLQSLNSSLKLGLVTEEKYSQELEEEIKKLKAIINKTNINLLRKIYEKLKGIIK